MSRRKAKRARKDARRVRRKRINRACDRKVRAVQRKSGKPLSLGPDTPHAPVNRAVAAVAPQVLSFSRNLADSLDFFRRLEPTGTARADLRIDLTQVREVTPGEVIYLLARIHHAEHAKRWASIRGNSPAYVPARRMFHSSGFLNYFRGPSSQASDDFVQIQCGTNADTQAASKITRFVREKLGLPMHQTSGLYKILIECMSNTLHHAYANRTGAELTRWWLIAYYDKDSRLVQCAFLDTGEGIPRTMRHKLRERLVKLFPGARSRAALDSQLIMSGLSGEFRTRTGQSHRGKGLPQISAVAQSQQIAELSIISGRGCVNAKTLDPAHLDRRFHGTLYSWTICETGDQQDERD